MVEMIIVMNPKCSEREVDDVKNELTKHGLGIHLSQGETWKWRTNNRNCKVS